MNDITISDSWMVQSFNTEYNKANKSYSHKYTQYECLIFQL